MPSGTIYVLLADINVSVVPCEVNNEKVRPCPHYGVNLAFLEVGLLSYLHLFGKIYYHIPQYQGIVDTHPALLHWQEKDSVYLSPDYSFQASVENFSLSQSFKYHKNMSK